MSEPAAVAARSALAAEGFTRVSLVRHRAGGAVRVYGLRAQRNCSSSCGGFRGGRTDALARTAGVLPGVLEGTSTGVLRAGGQVCSRPRRAAARSAPPPRPRTHLQPRRSARMLAPVARTTVAHGCCAYGSTRARAEWGDARVCVGDAPRRGTRRAHIWVLPSDTTPPICAQVRRVPDGDGWHAAGLHAVRDGARPPATPRRPPQPGLGVLEGTLRYSRELQG
jgi:hypothetical protein